MMNEKLQSKFMSRENGTLYYETYFTITTQKEISIESYRIIEDIILEYLETNY
jgi:hypothetical protein